MIYIDILKQTRNNFTKLVNSLSLEQLNTVPKGYKNNIFWNYAHNIVTLQRLAYTLAGLETRIPESEINRFKKDTTASEKYTQADLDMYNLWSQKSIQWLEEDLKNLDFNNYKNYPTSYGFTLDSIEVGLNFNNTHEGLHFGYAMAMRKLV